MLQVHSKATEFSSNPIDMSLDLEWWVGISLANDGIFKFESTGETMPFTPKTPPWKGNEPDGGSEEKCVTMNKGTNMFISDVSCTAVFADRNYHSVCEVSSSRTSPTGDYKIELCFERDSVKSIFFVDFLM